MNPREHIAAQLRDQARSCAHMGSPMYGELLARAASNVEGGGPAYEVLRDEVLPGRGNALALRFMAAVHRLALVGEAGELAQVYPSITGRAYDETQATEVWTRFENVLLSQQGRVRELVALPCQTNEVGRCAALIGGFLEASARWRLPLRLLEVGASGGLNLRCDHFRYSGGDATFGPLLSPVQLDDYWKTAPPHTDTELDIIERSGCDLNPVDPTTPEGSLGLRASIWADQLQRFARLKGAIELAHRIPVTVERASLEEWTRRKLERPVGGVTTVVFHSIVEEYLPDAVRSDFYDILSKAGARATREAPLVHLRLESVTALRSHGIEITHWPHGETLVRGRCGAHGQNLDWLAS